MPIPIDFVEQRAARRVGTVLRDKYTLERVLGVGGMATVYLGVHRNNRNRVAVKVLHPEASAEPDVVARFLREGYVANSIGHRGAVRVLDDDRAEDGAAFLVMELLEGETLHERAKRFVGKLPAREALAIARELLDVLAAAHERGVIHRDIKPENLFLTTDRALKVLDFGIARIADAPGTWTGAAMGTPAFMPPEQALGRADEVDARSDLWAVGATLFTLLTGRFVHEAKTGAETVVHAATRPAPSLATLAPDLPAPIVALVDRALAFDREDRFADARAMAQALDEAHVAAYGEPVSPASIGAVPLSMRHAPRSAGFDASLRETLPAEPSRPPTSRESAPTAPIAPTVPPALPSTPTRPSGDVRITRDTASRSTPPAPGSQARGAIVAVALALAAGAALVIARLRHPPSDVRVPPAGAAPCAADADCHDPAWICGSASRCEPRPAAVPACTESRACVAANGGKPAICRKPDGVCVPLESEDCRVLAQPGDVENDATIWVGAMFPLQGTMATSYGNDERDAVELARRDFAETVGGLPPARPGGPRRPIAVVMCDDAEQPARAATHLVDDLRVPAVLGFALSKEVADLATSHFNPKGVLALAANTSSILRGIPRAPGEPRLVWRTTVSSDQMTAPRMALLADLAEPQLRATPGLLAKGEPIRVALVRIGNSSGLATADRVVASLRFNGKSVAENGDRFRQFVFNGWDDAALHRREEERIASEIAAFRPHVVLHDIDDPLVPAVERAWPAAERFRPLYLGPHVNQPEIRAFVRAHPEAKKRILTSDTLSSTPIVAKHVLRHNEVFARKITASTGHGAPYDAFYVLAYAVAALGGEPVTGRALARAMPRLVPPGVPIDVGPGGIIDALNALASGKNIDLAGTTTSLDFDAESGEAPADFAIFCATPDGAAESGIVFRARSQKLEGTLRCP
jgi:serine/threonine-protein kinase